MSSAKKEMFRKFISRAYIYIVSDSGTLNRLWRLYYIFRCQPPLILISIIRVS